MHSLSSHEYLIVFTREIGEIDNFFLIYEELEGKRVQIGGWGGPKEAWHIVESALDWHRLRGPDVSPRPQQFLLPRG